MAARIVPALRRPNLWRWAERLSEVGCSAQASPGLFEARPAQTHAVPEIRPLRPLVHELRTAHTLQVRWMSGCQVRLGAPPPMKVVVEYPEEDSKALDLFISLANEIETEFPDIVVEGNPEESSPRDGSFEVIYGSSTLFSRLQNNRLPGSDEVIASLRQEYRPEEEARSIGCK